MDYKDLDDIIKHYEASSEYNKILAPHHLTAFAYYIGLFLFPAIIVFLMYLLKFDINIDNMLLYYSYALIPTTIIVITFFEKRRHFLKNEFIANYKKINNINEKIDYSDIRSDDLYSFLLNKHKLYFHDNNFNILIPYIETKESQLQITPEYILRKTLLVSFLVSFLTTLFSSIIPKFNIDAIDKNSLTSLEFIILSLIIIIFTYLFLSSAIKFKTKKEIERDKYRDLRSNLYKAKFRYHLEHLKENLNSSNNILPSSKKATSQISNGNQKSEFIFKSKLHKIIDILFE